MKNDDTKYVIGLDIGTTKIAVIIGKINKNNKLEIIGKGITSSDGVSNGVVIRISQTSKSIQKAVELAEQNIGMKISKVIVGIAGKHINSMTYKVTKIRLNSREEITEKELKEYKQGVLNLGINPGEKIIHVIPQEYTVDKEKGIQNPLGMMGSNIEIKYHIVIGQESAIQNIERSVEGAGLTVGGITLEPFASANAVLSKEEKDAGVVLVDIGGGTTDIAIYQDGVIKHTSIFPYGGNRITDDIKEHCAILPAHAENIKIKFGSASNTVTPNDIISIPGIRGRDPKEISRINLNNIIIARVKDLIDFIKYQINKSGIKDRLGAGIVLTGGGSELKNITKLFELETGIETKIGIPDDQVKINENPREYTPKYATSVGLVLDGFYNKIFQELELINKDVEKTIEEKNEKDKKDSNTLNKFKDFVERFFESKE